MPGTSVEQLTQITTTKLGSPLVAHFQASGVPGIALSATVNTVIDFSGLTSSWLVVPGVPMSCGYSMVDATTGVVVDYGVTVSENAPDPSGPGRWSVRLLVPPVSGAPHVWVNLYVTYFPTVTAIDSFT